MTIEEAIKRMEIIATNLCGQSAQNPNLWPDYKAVDMAISALRQQEHDRNEPLTLDELRQMPIRDWVWIDVFHSKEAVSSYYRKYDGYKKDEIFWCGYPGLGFGFDYADYGKTWLAYRQKKEV